eukprot:482821_1
MEEFNRVDFLANITLKPARFDANGSTHQVMVEVLNITQLENTDDNVYFPIILGAPWSIFSTLTAPVLGASNMGQISASATSVALSDTTLYPHFYRTMPSDALQSQALILLCKEMNWTSIAVVYVSDPYGLHLSLGITELAAENNISITSIGISSNDNKTSVHAATQIRILEKYITILIIHDVYIQDLFKVFNEEGIIGFPYMYLGVDAWFGQSSIKKYNLTKDEKLNAIGFIGTVPWQPDSLQLHDYNQTIRQMVNISKQKYTHLLKSCNICAEQPANSMIYGYDAVYTIVYAIEKLENDPKFYDMLLNADGDLINILKEIIINQTNFTGASGHVSFSESGDRENGLYSFGNILNDGNISYIGYLYYDDDRNSYVPVINVSKIVWPHYFTDMGISPRSHQHIQKEILPTGLISLISTWSIFVLSVVSIAVALFIMVSLCIYSKKNIVIQQWYIGYFICSGAILGYCSVILFTLDEGGLFKLFKLFNVSDTLLEICCNLRVCLLILSYSLIFIPWFAKTYELTCADPIRDYILLLSYAYIILVMLLIYQPYQRIEIEDPDKLSYKNKLQAVQYVYDCCSFKNTPPNKVLIFSVFLIKILESLYCVYAYNRRSYKIILK